MRSCHTQLIKQGIHTPEINDFDTFKQTADFSHTDRQRLEHTLSELKTNEISALLPSTMNKPAIPKTPALYSGTYLGKLYPTKPI